MKWTAAFLAAAAFGQTWTAQDSGVTSSLRGVSAVDSKIVWASGSGGTWLRTTDGGAHWQSGKVEGAAALDFRGIHAFSARNAILLSSGTGEQSKIYETADAGAHWTLRFTNPDAKGFLDGIAFWSRRQGIVAGDAVDGAMTVFTTDDGGVIWTRRKTPPALPNEGAYAASNSSLALLGRREVWFGTGGAVHSRVFHSKDGGVSWTVAEAPLRSDGPSAGIFSVAFRDAKHGIAVGGDYRKDRETRQNIAITADGGITWTHPKGEPPHGFRSAVVYLAGRKIWLATGTSGSDISRDDGQNWTQFDTGSFNALSGIHAVGAKGKIAVFSAATLH